MLSKVKEKFSGLFEILSKPFLIFEPNHLTLFGLIFSFFSFLAFYYKELSIALIFLILSALMDAMDGFIARKKGRQTKFGAFFDSNIDRISDALIILGIGFYIEDLFLAYIAMISFFMISYSRARAENFIEKCDVGIAERAERLIILIAATFLQLFFDILKYALIFLIFLSIITYIQRIIYTYRNLKK